MHKHVMCNGRLCSTQAHICARALNTAHGSTGTHLCMTAHRLVCPYSTCNERNTCAAPSQEQRRAAPAHTYSKSVVGATAFALRAVPWCASFLRPEPAGSVMAA